MDVNYKRLSDSLGNLILVGEVVNEKAYPVYYVKVTARFYNANGDFLATEYTYTYLTKTEAGVVNPFKLYLTNPPATIPRFAPRGRGICFVCRRIGALCAILPSAARRETENTGA